MLKDFFEKHRRDFVFSLLCNIGLLLYILIVFYCGFETNDDFAMKMIACGAYGSPDYHLVFISALIGYPLQFLYTLIPGFAWYEALQYLLILLSMSVITYVLLNRSSGSRYDFLVFVLMIISGHFLYMSLQFTKTASVLALAGYLLLADSLERNSVKGTISSLPFINLSYLFRRNQFLLTSLVCTALFFPMLYRFVKNRNDKKEQKRILRFLICAAACLFLFSGLRYLGKTSYAGEWGDYKAFNSTRAALLDREAISYDSDPEFYKGLGLNEIDVTLLYDLWDFDDPEVFTWDLFKTILGRQTEVGKDVVALAKAFVFDTILFFFNNKTVLCFTALLLIVLTLFLFQKTEKTKLISLLLEVALTAFCIAFTYFYRNSAYLERTHLSLVMATIVISMYQLKMKDSALNRHAMIAAVLIMTVFFSFYHFDDFRINSSFRTRDQQKVAAIREIKRDPDHLYIRTTDENLDYVTALFADNDVYKGENILALGGWTVKMPLRENLKERYGIQNPFKDIINNEKAYLIINDEETLNTIMEYIHYHYDPSAKTEKVKTIESNKTYTVYKVISE